VFHLTYFNSAHLPYLIKSPHYEITALCNSSVESAKTAIERHGLPLTTKAYGSPEDLARDPNVDLVVCCVRVDRHHALTMPSLQAGKAVFVEWPLAANTNQASEMLAAAQKSGSKTIVGLQSRANPVVQKIKHLVANKAIGELVSSNLTFAMGMAGDTNPKQSGYMADKQMGCNVFTVFGGHLIDAVQYSLGELNEVAAQLSTRWPDVRLVNKDGSLNRTIKRDAPDHVLLQGTLSGSDVPLSIYLRNGQGFPNTPNLVWTILGTKGEIRITSGSALNLGLPNEKIEVFDYEKDVVEVVETEYASEIKDLPMFAGNVGTVYELYANGGTLEQGLVGFEQAVALHGLLEAIEKSSEGKKWENVAK
jgi:predicted dehydrogenase